MELKTTYLELNLRSPIVISASPLSAHINNIKRMEAAGAGAVVLFSLFEEQTRRENQILNFYKEHPMATEATMKMLFPAEQSFHMDLDGYLNHIQQAKDAVQIPIIASLNCTSLGSWTEFAQKIEAVGADALELNIYFVPTSLDMTVEQIEDLYPRILKSVKAAVKIPVAVKMMPFFTNIVLMARHLDEAGASGLVLFNRFYGPDFDPKTLEVWSDIQLSIPQDSRLAMHWIAVLHRQLRADLAASTGIHTVEDIIKMLMVGAKVTMLASVILKEGIEYLRILEQGLIKWMEENDYQSIAELQGIMTQFTNKESSDFARTEYMKAITSFRSIG